MKTYIVRAAKYAIYLTILMFVIFAVMNALRPEGDLFAQLFSSNRGYFMIVVIVAFAALYPFMGYVKRTLVFDASQKVDEVVNVMQLCGYERVEGGCSAKMTFRAATKMKRLSMMGEDRVEIVTVDGLSTISGPRKEVVRASFRFNTFIG